MEQFKILIEYVRRLHKSDEGATAVEYSLLAALIAGAIISVVGLLGDRIELMFQGLLTALN